MLIILAVRCTLWWASPLLSISCWEMTSPTPTRDPEGPAGGDVYHQRRHKTFLHLHAQVLGKTRSGSQVCSPLLTERGIGQDRAEKRDKGKLMFLFFLSIFPFLFIFYAIQRYKNSERVAEGGSSCSEVAVRPNDKDLKCQGRTNKNCWCDVGDVLDTHSEEKMSIVGAEWAINTFFSLWGGDGDSLGCSKTAVYKVSLLWAEEQEKEKEEIVRVVELCLYLAAIIRYYNRTQRPQMAHFSRKTNN